MFRKGNHAIEKNMNENEFQFVMDCNVETLVSYLQEDYGLPIAEALDKVYNSRIYEKMIDKRTGLYLQSPAYIYCYLKEEIIA